MRAVLIVLVAAALLFAASAAWGQDVQLRPSAGEYRIALAWPGDPDQAQLCCYRVDVEPELDLGCTTDHVEYTDTQGVTHDASIYHVLVPVTLGADAEIRCRTWDSAGNVSADSPNAGLIDFSAPGPPLFIR